jgi:membrane dipeptidase
MIVDAHCDVLFELRLDDTGLSRGLVLREELLERHWLPRLKAGGVGVQVCPLYGPCAPGPGAAERALAQEAALRRAVEANAERVCLARTSADLADPRLRLVLSMEGVEPLEGDPAAFEAWYERGVRSASLTWNHANAFAGGIATPTHGLTRAGRRLVERFGELGVMLDLAHASEQTWRDVIETGVPFSVTHAACRAVHDHPRNLADWQLEALAACHGVLGVMALAFVVDPDKPTLGRWVDHVDHAIANMGIEHVGLGADFVDQVPTADPDAVVAKRRLGLDGFTDPSEYPAVAAALRDRGYDGDKLDAILSGNWLRALGAALPA